uniref:F-box domain-containing protein n=1 Tax=Caenorhabditis japonica TaxID=281687 RepID=A0A8R1EQE4_CAEJA
MTSEKPLNSYQATVAIVQNLPYGLRMHLAAHSMPFRRLHNRLKFTIKSLKMQQKREFIDASTGEWTENPNGILSICTDENEKSIDYIFVEKNEDEVEILCSLAPQKSIFTGKKDSLQRYFHYFMNTSENAWQHVELEECSKPFGDLKNLKIPSLKWTVNKGMEEEPFANFAEMHVFERLELINIHLHWLTEQKVKNAAHLIIRNSEFYYEYEEGNETANMIHFFGSLKNQLVEAEFRLRWPDTFSMGCDVLLKNNLKIGSSYTGIFETRDNLKTEIAASLLKFCGNSDETISKVDGKKHIVLKTTDDYIIAVFENYFGANLHGFKSFTALKIANKL